MVSWPVKANKVIVAIALLAAFAVSGLGWQISQSLRLTSLPPGSASQTAQPYQLLLGAVVLLGVVSALFWALRHNTRNNNRAVTRLQWMTHHLPGTFYVFRLPEDGIGSCEFLTSDVEDVFGVSRENILQDAKTALRLVVSEDRAQVNAALAHSRRTVSPLETDFRICKPNGEIRWVRTLAVPVRSTHNDVVWNGHIFDITQVKSSEQALRDANLHLEHVQSVAQLGTWSCDLGTGSLTWSAQIYQLLGRDATLGPPSLAEAIAMVLEGPELIDDAFESVRKTGARHSLEISVQLSNGNVVSLQLIVLPVSDAAGNITGMHGTIQDITEHKAREQQLVSQKEAADAASLAKGAFLATMSHEIRTPLNGMLGLLELIRRAPVNPEIRSALETVHDSGRSLQRIIDDILDFSKIEAGKLEITPEPTRLLDLIDSVHWTYAGSAKSLGLDFRQYVDPDISPVLMLDALRLRQILSNFVSNAIKFTPRGHVELRVVSEGSDSNLECLRFEVIDTGIGISAEEQKSLFQEFAQVHNDANRYGGSGLGLSICRRLAELMGGNVSMSSKPGMGTTLTLRILAFVANPALAPARDGEHVEQQAHPAELLSRTDSARTAEPVSRTEAAESMDTDMRILVVDDHPINRMVMRKQINALGYAAEEVDCGAQALEQWRTGRFSLVLTDLNMPHMSGHDLSHQIRKEEAELDDRRIPIIACSANAIPGVIQGCMDAGMDDYIAKPITLQVLSEKLNTWLPTPIQQSDAGLPVQQTPEGAAGEPHPPKPAAAGMPEASVRNEPYVTQRVLAHFRKVNDLDVMHLLEAIEHCDMEAVTRMAHRIKGACGFIGATGLATVCGMIEQAGREEDDSGVACLMHAFHMELEQLNANLDV